MSGAVAGPLGAGSEAAFESELATLLAGSLSDDPVVLDALTRLPGGLSWEAYLVEVHTGPARRHRRLVAKRPPEDGPLAPYDVAKEVAVAGAVRRAGLPAPEMVAHAVGPTVGGRPVMVMEFVDGDIPSLRSVEQWPVWLDARRRRAAGEALVALLADVQRVDWRATPAVAAALHGERSPRAQVAAVIDARMERIDKSVAPRWASAPVVRDAWLWLGDNLPALDPAELVIVHGDFRVGNVVWRGDRPAALLDWERACLGDPMQDLGFFCMPMARRRCPELMGMLLEADELVAAWERASGRPADLRRLQYYLIYWQFVELAQVLHGIAYLLDRAPEGDTTSLTSYPLLSSGTLDLVDLIERFEDGDHALR